MNGLRKRMLPGVGVGAGGRQRGGGALEGWRVHRRPRPEPALFPAVGYCGQSIARRPKGGLGYIVSITPLCRCVSIDELQQIASQLFLRQGRGGTGAGAARLWPSTLLTSGGLLASGVCWRCCVLLTWRVSLGVIVLAGRPCTPENTGRPCTPGNPPPLVSILYSLAKELSSRMSAEAAAILKLCTWKLAPRDQR